ncbi:hypothetical protein ACRAWD_03475 [Caulobacter segnis]
MKTLAVSCCWPSLLVSVWTRRAPMLPVAQAPPKLSPAKFSLA